MGMGTDTGKLGLDCLRLRLDDHTNASIHNGGLAIMKYTVFRQLAPTPVSKDEWAANFAQVCTLEVTSADDAIMQAKARGITKPVVQPESKP